MTRTPISHARNQQPPMLLPLRIISSSGRKFAAIVDARDVVVCHLAGELAARELRGVEIVGKMNQGDGRAWQVGKRK